MKLRSILLLTTLLFAVIFVDAQAPLQFNYQAVARDSRGVPLSEKNITMRFSIRDGSENGDVEYMEIRKIRTNQFGMFSVAIGSEGAYFASGTLKSVNWKTGKKFLQAELDPKGGNNYVNLGATQLVSVPYALFALSTAEGPSASFSGAARNGLSIQDSMVMIGNRPGATDAMLTEDRVIPLGGKSLSIIDNRSSISFSKELIRIQQDSVAPEGTDPNLMGTFLRVDPIIPREDAVPFYFNRTATPQLNGTVSPNEVVTWGHNIGGGGQPVLPGLPGIGYSLESNYKPTRDSRLVESHEFYLTPAGKQIRLKSYTIYTENDQVDFYHSTHKFYLKNPITGEPYFYLFTGLNDVNNKQMSLGRFLVDVNESNKQVQLISAEPGTELYIKNNWSLIHLPGLIMQENGLLRLTNNLIPESDNTSSIGHSLNRFGNVYSSNYSGKQLALNGNWANGSELVPSSTLDIDGVEGFNQFRLRKTYTPTSSSDANGNVGDISWDENYIYIKTAAGWKRTTLSSF